MLDTYGIVVAAFSVIDKANQVKFFEETFSVANISPEVVFRMLFFILCSVDVAFSGWELWWRTYITEEALSTIKHIQLIEKKEFAAIALNPVHEIFVFYIASLSAPYLSYTPLNVDVHPSYRSQISGLIAETPPTKILVRYLDFVDKFFLDLASELLEHTEINDYAIKLVYGQRSPYGLIYSLRSVELETLKAYIKTNLANVFIRRSKSPTNALILFNQKSNSFF